MTKHFPDPLRFEDADMRGDSRVFRLLERFRYISGYGTLAVPAGFETDGASIPRAFWNVLSPFGPYFKAAVVHDFLYSALNDQFNREDSDAIFKEAMFNIGIGWVQRELIYRSVRAAGWRFFKGTATI